MTIGRWTPVIVWAGVILVATSLPSSSVPSGPTGVDKGVHLLAYGVLGALAARAARRDATAPLRTVLLLVGSIALFGALDEWHQGFVPGRMPDVADWVADVAGATVGIGSMTLLTLRRSARS